MGSVHGKPVGFVIIIIVRAEVISKYLDLKYLIEINISMFFTFQ
jgi:hypothetical protein